MALTVDEIAEIINTMRVENENNVQNVERVLTGINNKLDMMADDNEATDLIRVYISELKKSVDEKHSITVEKFNEAANYFNNLSAANEELAKTSELKDLFNALRTNIGNFSNEIASQKNILTELDEKLNQLGMASLTKDEMNTLAGEISLDLSGISSEIENSFKELEDKLTETVAVIHDLDNSEDLILVKNGINNLISRVDGLPASISHFQNIFDSLREVISQTSSDTSSGLNEKFEKLENSFNNIVTDSDFKGFKQDLADFVQKIIDNSSALNAELSYSTERIENILITVKALDFRDDFENIVRRINDLKDAFEEGSNLNYSNLSGEISAVKEDFDRSFDNLDEKRQEAFSSLKSRLDQILADIGNLLNNNYQDKLDEISGNIASISNDVNSLRSGISSDFQDDYGDLKAGLGEVISSLQLVKEEIISKNESSLLSSNQNFEQFETKIDEQARELAGLKVLISDTPKVNQEEIISSLNKISGDLSLLVTEAKDNANSNYEALRDYIEEVSATVNGLQSEFSELTRQNADKILSGISDVASSVETLRDEFKQAALTDLENSSKILDSVVGVSSKIDSVEQTLTGNARGNFESLKSLLEELSKTVADDLQKQQDVFVQSNLVGDQQKLELLQNLSNDIKRIEDILGADIEDFKLIVREDISGIKDYINEMSSSVSSTRIDSENKLTAKLESIEALSHAFEASVSSVHDEIKNVIDKISSLDFSETGNEIKLQISNIISTSNSILASINNINSGNSELRTLFSNISEILASKDDVSVILNKLDNIEKQDYSYDLTQLSSKIDDLSSLFETSSNSNYTSLCEKIDRINENIHQNDISETVLEKIDNVSGIIAFLKDIIENSSEENKTLISEKLEKFEAVFSRVVTAEDFGNFRKDFTEFLQKLFDGAGILQVNSEANREQIEAVLEKVNSIDYSADFENIAGRINEIRTSFENNSKMNYENLVNEITNLKNQLNNDLNDNNNINRENFDRLNADLSDLLSNLELLRDLSDKNSFDTVQKISDELHLLTDEIGQKVESSVKINIADLKLSLGDMINEINAVKDDFEKKNDTNIFNVSTGFDNLKLSMENVLSALTSFNDDLKNLHSENLQNIQTNIDNVSAKVDELKNELQHISESSLNRVYDSVNAVSVKLDGLSEGITGDIVDNVVYLKEIFARFSNDVKVLHEESVQQIKEDSNLHLDELKSISGSLDDFKNQVNEAVESLKLYISELDAESNNSKEISDNKLIGKLLDLESALSRSSEEYEQKMEILQGKLSEFVQIVENSTSDTEAKIASSLDEITEVKSELTLINDLIKTSTLSSDENAAKSVNAIDNGVETIINSINGIDYSVVQGIEPMIKESLVSVEENFSNLLGVIDGLKENAGGTNTLIENIEEKVAGLKQEIGLINTDISDAIQCKTEEIIRAFDPVRTSIEEFSGYDFEKVISELKSQLELSFANFSSDVNGELASASGALAKIEHAFKETFNKISVIEECVCDKIQNNIELINVTFEKSAGLINHSIDEKFDECLSDLKAHLDIIANNNKEVEYFNEMSSKLDKIEELQTSVEHQGNAISSLDENIKNYLQSCGENQKSNELLESLNDKVDVLAMSGANDEILNTLDEIEENAEKRSGILISDIKTVNERLNSVSQNGAKVSEMLSALNDKVDILALGNETEDTLLSDIKDVNDKLNNVSQTETKVWEMLSALHSKVDVLAADDSEFDIAEEIDDIKDLIFEQRKFFEATSDEKAAAIDKYLRDLLLKLDNLDLEKNSEDVKDSIMNALVSLFDQISFVEETEEIKDFVEEKTDEIKQNLIQVQTQLHQIASSNDDFDYSYTLQDVESDIAKLRLAMNQMSAGADFEGLSDDIRRIVTSVEGLESSLTQDQIVGLKGDIEKLNEDILSISSRTNKLLLTSDESYKALNDGLNNFSSLVYRLEDRINELDKTQISERLEKKIDSVHSMAVASANADKVFHQVMMYLGEWIDSTTENISSITDNTAEISHIKENIEELRAVIPEKTALLDELQLRFEKQEERISELEMKLDKILSTLEEKDDMVLNRKVDKIEKLLSRLGNNIEKLTSYVDEE